MKSLSTPSVDIFLQSYKSVAKLISRDDSLTLTQVQHNLARDAGFKDWQSFTYFFKTISDLDLGLDKYELQYLFSLTNHVYFDINIPKPTEFLISTIQKDDSYEYLGSHLLKTPQLTREIVKRTLIERKNALIEKIRSMGSLKLKALLASSLLFWHEPYFEKHFTLMSKYIDTMNKKRVWSYQNDQYIAENGL